MATLCDANSGLPADNVVPAYEDPADWMVKEAQAAGQRHAREQLSTDRRRDATASSRVFERGLTEPSGFVLPVISGWQAQDRGRRWMTEKWKLRRGHLFLVPGDSPGGLPPAAGALPYVRLPTILM